MPRKQISAMETCPLNSLDDRAGLGDEHDGKGVSDNESMAVTPTLSNKSKHKIRYDDDDDDDEKPVQDNKVINGWDLLLYYAKNSTMHGIPTIVGSELYRGRHIFWTGVVCVMAILLGTVVYFQMSNYYDYPTVTSVDIRYVGENDFPAITMCNLNVFDGHKIKQHLDDYTIFQLTKLTEITGLYMRFGIKLFSKIKVPPSNGSSDEMVNNLLDDLLRFSKRPVHCSWGEYFWVDCPAVSYRVTEMGVCATMDVRKLPKINVSNDTAANDKDGLPAISNSIRGLTLWAGINSDEIPNRMYSFTGYKVVLHEPDEVPLPLSSGFLVTGNTTAEVEISKTVKMGLPSPYKAFGSGSCVDTLSSSFVNPLKRYQKYNKEVCEAECFVDFVVKVCGGCRHFLHPGNESVCRVDHLANCFRSAEKQYYGGQVNGSIGRPSCKCLMPCTQSMYRASVTTSPFDQTAYFKNLLRSKNMSLSQTLAYIHIFYSDPVVSEMRQVAVFSMEGLLGNIGGQIGLFMGFSLVSVAEMLELIFLLVTRGRNLDERVKRHKNSQAAAKAALQA